MLNYRSSNIGQGGSEGGLPPLPRSRVFRLGDQQPQRRCLEGTARGAGPDTRLGGLDRDSVLSPRQRVSSSRSAPLLRGGAGFGFFGVSRRGRRKPRGQVFGYDRLIELSDGTVGKTAPYLVHPKERNPEIVQNGA
jgi:hypothetical protein